MLATDSLRSDPAGEGRNLAVRRLDGTGLRTLAIKGRINDIAWSGDGRKLAYVEDGDIYLVDCGLRRPRLFRRANTEAISWSRQGRLAWTPGGDSGGRIYVTDRSRKRVRKLPLGRSYGVQWSPNGRWLCSHSDPTVVFRADGKGKRIVVPRCDTFQDTAAWSPDGRLLMCSNSVGDLITVELKTRRTRLLIRNVPAADEFDWQARPVQLDSP